MRISYGNLGRAFGSAEIKFQVVRSLSYIIGWQVASLVFSAYARITHMGSSHAIDPKSLLNAITETGDLQVIGSALFAPFIVLLLSFIGSISKKYRKSAKDIRSSMAEDLASIWYNVCGYFFAAGVFIDNAHIDIGNQNYRIFFFSTVPLSLIIAYILGVYLTPEKDSATTGKDGGAIARGRASLIPSTEVHQRMMSDPTYRQAWADSELPMQIAFELCDARQRSGISRAELAHRIDAAEPEVAKWEKGDGTIPDLQALRRYAEATGSRLRITLTTEP